MAQPPPAKRKNPQAKPSDSGAVDVDKIMDQVYQIKSTVETMREANHKQQLEMWSQMKQLRAKETELSQILEQADLTINARWLLDS